MELMYRCFKHEITFRFTQVALKKSMFKTADFATKKGQDNKLSALIYKLNQFRLGILRKG